ncbi:hypothetical protein HPB49_012705 [Dermacentor silvarum]|uniref:Uncharacterized protein n=1 Tax=Dermacentor silvarum TaxID=543639 RepID=A0ACB8C9E4_DERSI|nr:hypothetical protein HPB49_012705 [Dermacentor silvarum]
MRLTTWLKKKWFKKAPPALLCTELPQQWRRPRRQDIKPTNLHDVDWRSSRQGGAAVPTPARLFDEARNRASFLTFVILTTQLWQLIDLPNSLSYDELHILQPCSPVRLVRLDPSQSHAVLACGQQMLPRTAHSMDTLACAAAALLLLIATCIAPVSAQDVKPRVKLSDLVSEEYDVMQPPIEGGQPIVVNVSVSVLNIRSVDEGRQFVEVDLFLHEYWYDFRLNGRAKNKVIVDPRWYPELWTPEVYFKNSADGRLDKVIFPYAYVTLEPSGHFFLAARVSLKLACNMDLSRFPHDNQFCDMQLSSLVHPREQVILHWKAFRITKNLSLSQFKAIYVGHGDCTKSFDVGTFSCLYGRVELRRRAGYSSTSTRQHGHRVHVVRAFWMPCEALPARVTLSVTSCSAW